jgi:hypothetical protein
VVSVTDPYARILGLLSLFVIPCLSGFINFYYLFIILPISRELMIYFSYCFISINNTLLMRCHSFVVLSGFLRNEFDTCLIAGFIQ